jgi:hypothetical protein
MFMKNAEKTVLLDAHLEYDSMVKDFIEDLYKPSEVLVCRYDHNPMKRTIVHYDGDMVSMLCKIRRVLAEGKRIICVFRSKKEMHTVKDQISAMTKTGDIAFFDGKSSAEHMAKFQDIDAFLRDNNIQVLMYTSKVTVTTKNTQTFTNTNPYTGWSGHSTAH